jgi:hypothetical protein
MIYPVMACVGTYLNPLKPKGQSIKIVFDQETQANLTKDMKRKRTHEYR